MTSLIIIESPAKIKSFQKYLGDSYKIMATCGHLTELKGLEDIDEKFVPTYSIIPAKRSIVKKIGDAIASSQHIYLACDNDREGEAINAAICQLFGLPDTTKRLIYNEITEHAIQQAILHPTTINAQMVKSQRARQIIDLLVGFNLSPLLWKNIKDGRRLSAGRCQSTALRMVYDNDVAIQSSTYSKKFDTVGYFKIRGGGNSVIPFHLVACPTTQLDMFLFLKLCSHSNFTAHTPKHAEDITYTTLRPPAPLNTAALQQVSSYSCKETMECAQELYEAGYITYMRTESTTFSAQFGQELEAYITREYGEDAVGSAPVAATTIAGAHEAIRPTNIAALATEFKKTISTKAAHLYHLIRLATLQSAMTAHSYATLPLRITMDNDPAAVFVFNATKEHCAGWMRVGTRPSYTSKEYDMFMMMSATNQPSSPTHYTKIVSSERMERQGPYRYTEASLIKNLYENGIGRPSTYASIINKIKDKGYAVIQSIDGEKVETVQLSLVEDNVEPFIIKSETLIGKETNKLVLQPVGRAVIEFLLRNFEPLINYGYTNKMETYLDLIVNGEKTLEEVCELCNSTVHQCIGEMKGAAVAAPMPSTPAAPNSIFLGSEACIYVKKGRYGVYFEWTNEKGEKKTKSYKTNRPMDNITLKDAKKSIGL